MRNRLDLELEAAQQFFLNQDYVSAEVLLQIITKKNPTHSRANELLGCIKAKLGDVKSAVKYLQIASAGDKSPESLYYLGKVYLHSKMYSCAISCFKKSLLIAGDYFEGLHDLGTALALSDRKKEALLAYQTALTLNNSIPEIYFNLARICEDLFLFDSARNYYLYLKNNFHNYPYILGDICHLDLINFWHKDFLYLKNEIKNMLNNQGKNIVTPLIFLSIEDSPKLQQVVACSFTLDRYPSSTHLPAISHKPHNRIRIAYFSSDFRSHAVSYLIAELFELHNRNCFEIYGFSLASPPPEDKMSQRLRSTFDHFYEVSERSPLEIVQLARGLEIDIAFDLNGHTQGAQTSIFAHRVAPIQINYLGYPGTMGAEYMDYIIADQHLIPPQSRPFYTEKIIYLPHSFQINDSKRKNINSKLNRLDFNLPPEGFLFCCFNNTYKINLEMLCIWSEILKNVPNSYLWLLSIASSAEDNIRNQALDLGIESRRLIFGHRLERNAYLERFQLADLFLDTLPFNGGTTISDALWAGLPVLTQTGNSFAARMGTSLLNAVNLPELIASSRDEYIRTAIELAGDSNRLSKIKQKLTKELKTSPLFNTAQFTKNFENAIQQAYEKYLTKREPEDIWVKQ